jgi:hypothetical protein
VSSFVMITPIVDDDDDDDDDHRYNDGLMD